MTDNKIIPINVEKYAEALNNLIGTDSAYFNGDKDVDAIVEIIILAKKMESIINRQKAEIESLTNKYEMAVAEREANVKGFTAEIEKWKKNCDDLYEQMSERQKAEVEIAKRMGKVEAIKEFAERLKAKAYTNNYCQEIVLADEIDNLVDEMTEGNNAES